MVLGVRAQKGEHLMHIDEMPLNTGVIFERTYDILIEKMKSGVNRLAAGDSKASVDAALLVSVAVNGAFASELYMKSLLPEGTKGHDLKSLYDMFDDELKAQIKSRTVANMKANPEVKEYDDLKFDTDLSNMGKSFVEWRYLYQYLPSNAAPQFYKALMQAVREAAVELKGANA